MAPAPMAAAPAEELQTQDKRVLSLPQLQNLMKKDPEAYEPEFDQQWSHFQSQMEIFKLKPQKPHNTFSEQVMFLAHVAPSFPSKAAALPGAIIGALSEHDEIMHPQMRSTLVSALILLRNRDQFPCLRALPLYFKLFRLNDKSLRNMIFKHVVRDIVDMNKTCRNQKIHGELVDFFFGKLKETDENVSRRACAVFISLNRQNIWKDSRVVNLMSAGLTHPDVKIAAALAHLFLGNKTKGLDGILEESDDEEEEEDQAAANEAAMRIVGAKKTANRAKRVKRAKKAAQKAVKKKQTKAGAEGIVSFVAIDLLHDPQTLAERMLHRLSKGSEPYLFRLLMLHLLARIVGRNHLQLLNFYPYLLKYLQPSQKQVTKVLACLVEATHSQVSPDEIRPVVIHIMKTFVTESQQPEVIEVGLNCIREVCARTVNVLNEEELADLAEFRKFKNKGVSMAAKGLINVYRELHPELLHRSLRGREATMALSRGELSAPMFGSSDATDQIDGLELLVKKKQKEAEDGEDGDSDDDDPEGTETAQTTATPGDAKSLMTDQVLSSEDFQKLRKLRLQRSVELQLGRKRKPEEMSSSDSDGSSSDEDDSADERGLTGRLPDAISGDQLKVSKKRAKNKQERMAMAKSNFDLKERIAEKRAQRKGGKTNAENARNKPLKMVTKDSEKVKRKSNLKAKDKVRNLKKHIKTLKMKCKHKHRR